MGQKLNFPESDDLFEDDGIDVEGITGACYCCGTQIIISFGLMSSLPFVQIGEDVFYVFLCETCEGDIESLKWGGVEDLSYDVLWLIQEELDEEILKFTNKNNKKECSDEERAKILIQVYKKADEKIKREVSKNYLKQLTKDRKNGNS